MQEQSHTLLSPQLEKQGDIITLATTMSFSVFALIAFIGVGGMLISCHNGYSSEPEREMCAYCFGFHGMIYSIVFWLVGIVAISLWDSIRNEKTMEGK